MSLSMSTFLLAPNLVSTHSFPQSHSLASSVPVRQFELDDTFRDSHMVVSCVLRRHQARIQALTLIDSGVSGYAFMDQNFAQKHSFPLHKLKYPRRLFGFDGRPARTGNITHVTEATFEKLLLFVTGLQHYPIVLGHPWLRRHGALADFANNILSLSSEFCLNHCSPTPVKIKAITSDDEKFLLPAEIPNLQQDLGKAPKTQVSDLIQDQSDPVDLPRLSIREIEAVPFAHLSAKPGYETFSLSLRDLDRFLDRPGSNTPPVSDSILTSNVSPSRYIPDSHLTASENRQQENLFKMTQALSLATNTTTEELEEYRRRKNVDPATLLPKRYHEFLDVFSKREADTLPIHRPYDHAKI